MDDIWQAPDHPVCECFPNPELANVLAEIVLSGRRFRYKQHDQQLMRLLIRLISVAVAVVIVIEEMQQIGFSIATLIAGAGVSGLAVALAAQGVLKKYFCKLLVSPSPRSLALS